MTTGLAQEYQRSHDPEFRHLVEAALARIIPDVLGEAAAGPLTQAQVDKRQAWAMEALRNIDTWVARAALILAGENAIRAVDIGTVISDTVIYARLLALVPDMAGVKAGD